MLKGKNVNLRKPDIYDAELFNKWFADLDYAKAFNSSVLNSKSQAKLSFLLEENLKTYGNTQTFIIENKKGEGLGFICLSFIRWKSKCR
ncbi:MAG: hypothetical protein LBU09_02205, partial [Endomicrobium sp.]|nr:hypothetical protein [Endomicrobium sp.]